MNIIQELFDVEEKLGDIRAEIESTEAKFARIQQEINYSTISLTIYKPGNKDTNPDDKFSNRISNSFTSGWQYFVDFSLFVFSLWPFLLIAAIIYLVVIRIRKK